MFQPHSEPTSTFLLADNEKGFLGFAIGAYMQSCNTTESNELNNILLKLDNCGPSIGVTARETELIRAAVEFTKCEKYKRKESSKAFEDLAQLLLTPQVDLNSIMFSRRRVDFEF